MSESKQEDTIMLDPEKISTEPSETIMKEQPFEGELIDLINRHCKENYSNTPDYILAQYICGCLESFTVATRRRDEWLGFKSEFSDGMVTCISNTAGKEIKKEIGKVDGEDNVVLSQKVSESIDDAVVEHLGGTKKQ